MDCESRQCKMLGLAVTTVHQTDTIAHQNH